MLNTLAAAFQKSAGSFFHFQISSSPQPVRGVAASPVLLVKCLMNEREEGTYMVLDWTFENYFK